VSSGRAWARATAALVALLASATAAIADDGDRAPTLTPALTLAEALAEAQAQSPILGAAAEDGRRAAGLARAAAGVDDLIVEVEAEGLVRSSEAGGRRGCSRTPSSTRSPPGPRCGSPLPWGRSGRPRGPRRARALDHPRRAGPAPASDVTTHDPQPERRAGVGSSRSCAIEDAALTPPGGAPRRSRSRPRPRATPASRPRVALEVARAYWELAYAERELELRAHALVLARDQLAVTQARAGVGHRRRARRGGGRASDRGARGGPHRRRRRADRAQPRAGGRDRPRPARAPPGRRRSARRSDPQRRRPTPWRGPWRGRRSWRRSATRPGPPTSSCVAPPTTDDRAST
jgi:hypothetical protein